ncbi:DNA replication and repair protein RecF [Magnetococcus marinus MC-1]|uniref:DNA replication and repair protein RecF n=1 Tax=Magnetococcus marinus (strain ATCC BAA-1437 / JCM 17883 / MC-1) TaxID=156889 RepID=RECF_MAGMM|nr:DNA replication and repair protein RecF [Magnetococcus marinus]A0L3I9.1 RecName: Full=DNA replication and repair protein RecF [Magnetococcus marinus MC-1]ABK42532.1 DNA replication and repair protein RecF [Magnetococcus marinus MC-1]
MQLDRLTLRDFRNITEAELRFGPGLNLITGPNGHGKSNLLEAIGLLATGRSFRRAPAAALRRYGQPWFHLRGETTARDLGHRLEFFGQAGRQAVKINGKSASAASALGQALAAVIVTPDTLRLVQDGPGVRRGFVDWVAFTCGRQQGALSHAVVAGDYQKALKARNRLLKLPRVEAGEWLAWESQLATLGAKMARNRYQVLQRLQPHLDRMLEDLGMAQRLTITLSCQLDRHGTHWAEDESAAASLYRRLLAENRASERRSGGTAIGPHRDDLVLRLDGHALAQFGSQGQQKRAALALKLAEAQLLQEQLGEWPLFVLDDPAAELDTDGMSRLMGLLARCGGQIFVASCRAQTIPWSGLAPQRFYVDQGVFALTEEIPLESL